MDLYKLVLGILAVWRVTHLLQAEDGPWDVVVHLRRRAGVGFWGQLFDCFYCLSVWVAAPFAVYIGHGLGDGIVLWLALSGGAILLERATASVFRHTQALYVEESEEDYVLRQKAE